MFDSGDAEEVIRTAFDPQASAGLFVGVSRFEDSRIYGVPYAVDDAVDLAHLFSLELELVPPNRAVLLLAGDPCKSTSVEHLARLIQSGAQRANARQHDIYRYLEELTRSTGERGLFVLAIATHGLSDQGSDFLLAADSIKGRSLRSGVAVAEVLDEMARVDTRTGALGRRLVLLDACRERLTGETRGEGDLGMAKSFAEAISHAKGVAILSGSTLGGFAYDDRERENGVFTAALLDGLRGEAPAGPEGWITVRTLADYVQERVMSWVRRRRPDHAAKSLGIGRHIESTAGDLPLAPHPVAMKERRGYRARREAALLKVRENQGSILTGALWDQVVRLLPAEPTLAPDVEQLLGEIEALDGSERSQRALRDLLRERGAEIRASPSRRSGQHWFSWWLPGAPVLAVLVYTLVQHPSLKQQRLKAPPTTTSPVEEKAPSSHIVVLQIEVVDAREKPIPAAVVKTAWAEESQGFSETASTDGDGRCTFQVPYGSTLSLSISGNGSSFQTYAKADDTTYYYNPQNNNMILPDYNQKTNTVSLVFMLALN